MSHIFNKNKIGIQEYEFVQLQNLNISPVKFTS